MGYRNFLAKMPKSIYEEIKDKTYEEVCEYVGDEYFRAKNIEGFDEFYELGKYCEFDVSEYTQQFFSNFVEDEETEFLLASKEFFSMIIEDYRKYVVRYYERLLEGDIENYTGGFKTPEDQIKDIIKNWSGSWRPYDLSENNNSIVSRWEYEYAIFELVRLYKIFDWENDVLIYTGH